MSLRDLARRGLALAHVALGASRRARRQLDGSRAVVLMYHRVLPAPEARRDAVEDGMYVAPETFGRHLDWLRDEFRVLPLHEIADRLGSGRPLPERACAITFDDGWRDNAEHALPELERRGLPATLFVVTERMGTDGAFWPDEVCRRLRPLAAQARAALAARLGAGPARDPLAGLLEHLKALPEDERERALEALRAATRAPEPRGRELLSWDELDRLARCGVDVESHGATHAILPHLGEDAIRRELHTARERLRERGHGRHALLAYPSGAHDERVVRIAGELGHRAAVTVERGLARTGGDPLRIPRVGLHEDISRTRVEFLWKSVPAA
ncbi:MAG TPA: polysaccharide deacetylase family protein [Myxococcota bacterium]|nr:polysaccharide deacetylase family protein [Myxococcota bacterium]